jgi:hypothetical protein
LVPEWLAKAIKEAPTLADVYDFFPFFSFLFFSRG